MVETKKYLDLNADELTVGGLYFIELKRIYGTGLKSKKSRKK